MKRILALLLVLCLAFSLFPTVSFAEEAQKDEPKVLTEEDYLVTDAVWADINELEDKLEARRATPNQRIEAVVALVEASANYVEGSLERHEDCFTWKTDEGIACLYSYNEDEDRGESIGSPIVMPESGVKSYSYAEKGQTTALDIYVIGPYYGYQSDFTDHYEQVAKGVAAQTGGKVTIYGGTAATIDVIADCIEKGALVMIDSHGTYANSKSYLRLKSGTGLTTADYNNSNAYYGDSAYMVTGTVISNHMEKNAPNSFVWFGICSGMRYNTMHAPLLARGVEATFGYSRTISFHYDRYWLSAFCNSLKAGNTAATAAAAMKTQYGYWDRNDETSYNTYSKAVNAGKAFPIFVSAEDAYPGSGSVQNYQTVKSTWKLRFCDHPSATYVSGVAASCTTAGKKEYYDCDTCELSFSDAACTTQISTANLTIAALGHNTVNGICTRCGYVSGITMWHFWQGSTEAGITWDDEGSGSSKGVSNNDNGVLYAVSAGGDHYVFPTKGSVSMGHTFKAGDVVEIRYRTVGIPASKVGMTGTFELWYTTTASEGLSSSRSYSKTVTRAENTWQTVEFTLPTGTAINRLCYDVFEDNGGYSGAKFEIDYVYVGPSASKPSAAAQDSLLFDFTNDFPSELRYAGPVYNDRSYDTRSWAGNSANVKNITFNNAESNVSFELADGTTTAYIQTSTYENTLTATPLNYAPSAGDYVQIRLKMENLQAVSGQTPSLRLYYIKDNATSGVNASDYTELTTLTDAQFNGEYLTFSAPLSDNFTTADVINALRVQLVGVSSVTDKIGKVSVDYIAVAQRNNLPEELPETYTVTFKNYDGTVLETKTVYAGSTATYTEAEPEKPYDSKAHYTFEGWDKATGNIQSDSVFTAQFIAEDHVLRYTDLGTQHKGECTCGYSVTADHAWDNGKVTSVASCTQDGVTTYTCATCKLTKTETVEASGHKTEIIAGKAATCTASGLTDGEKCTVCGEVTVAQTTIPRLGHSYTFVDNGDGTHSETCIRCSKTVGTDIHSIVNGVCIACGAGGSTAPIYDETIKFSHSLTLENDISINFIGQGSVLSTFDSFYLECTVPVYEGNEKVGIKTVNIEPSFNGTNYEFTLLGITAKMMNDEIEAVFRLTKDGQEYYSKTDVYSVAEYAYGKLNSTKATDTDELKTLCANLLRYGAMAQTQFGYRTDALVDADMTTAHEAYLTALNAVSMTDYRKQVNDLTSPTVPWKSTTLELGNKVIMCLIVNLANYTGDVSELSMRLTYTDAKGQNVTVERPLELYNADAKTYAVSYDGLRATEMRTIVSAAIYNGSTRVSRTVEYSIESYAARNSSDLTRAMLAYGDSASAFFAN